MTTILFDAATFGAFATACALIVWNPAATVATVIRTLLSWALVLLSLVSTAGGLFAYFWDRVVSWGLIWSCLTLVAALVATLKCSPLPIPDWLRRIL